MKILYFAQLRERLNRDSDEVELPADVRTVADLIHWLKSRDEAIDLAMQKPEIFRAAIDARMVRHEASVVGAKVVALLPPMTGG